MKEYALSALKRLFVLASICLFGLLSQPGSWADPPTPEILLKTLKALDSKLAQGFTAEGTIVRVPVLGSDRLPARYQWKFTRRERSLAFQERMIEVLKWSDVLLPGQEIPPPEHEDPAMRFESFPLLSG